MARKKSKRPNLPQQTLAKAKSELYGNAPSASAAVSSGGAPVQVAKSTGRGMVSIEDLKVEYAYVINDLRSMAILSAVLIIALVVVSKALV